ncbi:class I SAM-dependent methyltransferase [Herpetosiphon llansteffanensis]|uniref:class I SAM-dependent methyltransferase n=1 Tax=Herpetosiphon llansteffanensis TaxID=2094568 RepID=UPI000D7D2345|nr:class I SAM-dependent methyltransferase [Herpetosiphon llansteffanensis]
MGRFGEEPLDFFTNVYTAVPPWDVAIPQPALIDLINAFPPQNLVLDVGCGSGDLAIGLAQLGYSVVGVDFVPSAIEQAREKVAALPVEVAQRLSFEVGDGLKPSLLPSKFGAIVDTGFYHLFNHADSEPFIADLAQALQPQGRYYLLAFGVEFASVNVPRAITEAEIRSRFTAERGWRILALHPAEFLNRVGPPVASVAACIERL